MSSTAQWVESEENQGMIYISNIKHDFLKQQGPVWMYERNRNRQHIMNKQLK